VENCGNNNLSADVLAERVWGQYRSSSRQWPAVGRFWVCRHSCNTNDKWRTQKQEQIL